MNLHSGARSCPASRALLIERIEAGSPITTAAEAIGVSRRTAYKWLARFAREGVTGLRDRDHARDPALDGGPDVEAPRAPAAQGPR